MKKTLFSIMFLLIAVNVATAQDDITKQMEVTKAYTPKVGRAAKLPVEPRMVDTVQLRPDIEYTITPTAWQTVFETERYNPARISVTPYEKNRPLYLRIGAGYPLQSTADIYFNPYIGNRSTFGIFLNHRGQFSKIANERGQKLNSTEMLNGVGLYGTKHFRRYKLEGDFGYENRLHNPYGVFPEIEGVPASAYTGGADAIDFGRAVGNISFGDSFADLGRFNFRVGLRAGYFHNSLPYQSGIVQTRGQADIDLWVKAARMYGGKHGFEAGVYERGALGLDHFSGTNNFGVMFDPKYVLSLPKFDLRAGIDLIYLYDGIDKSSSVMPLPHIDARLNIAKGYFTPYLSGKGQITDGSTAALSFRNPFADGWGVPGWRYDLRLGFRGGVNSVFSYNLWGGISQLENYSVLTPVNRFSVDAAAGNALTALDGSVLFAPLTDDVTLYTAGADIQIATAAGFSARLYGDWYSYNPKRLPVVDGMPKYDAGLELKYVHRELFTLSAGARLVGGRKSVFFLADAANPITGMAADIITDIPAAVDVTLAAEVKLTKGLWIFAEGRNLANQQLYPYSYYRGVGANVMAGIKAVF